MRRDILLAFALGAAAVLVSTYAGYTLKAEPEPPTKVVRSVFAPHLIPIGGERKATDNLAFATGEVIHECGIADFRVNIGDTNGLLYELDITPENLEALRCIEEKAPKLDQSIELGFRVATP